MESTEITATRTRRTCRRLASAVAFLAAIALVPGAAAADTGDRGAEVSATAAGGGHYLLDFGDVDLPGRLSFAVLERADGTAHGRFRIELDLVDQLGGGVASFRGEVTCLSVDAELGRAWIGGTITANRSTSDLFRDETTEVGDDIWFRVLDTGEGGSVADRTTFAGFEGGGGIATSQEYCDAALWPEGNARTHPLTAGNIQVRG